VPQQYNKQHSTSVSVTNAIMSAGAMLLDLINVRNVVTIFRASSTNVSSATCKPAGGAATTGFEFAVIVSTPELEMDEFTD